MRVLLIADATPASVVADGLIQGLRAGGHEVLAYGPGREAFYGFDVPIRDALAERSRQGPRFYPDQVWCCAGPFVPDWDGLECPRILAWVEPCEPGPSELARQADGVFVFQPQLLDRARRLNPRTWCLPYGVDDSVFHLDLTLPRMYHAVCTGAPSDEELRPLRERMGHHLVAVEGVWGRDRAHFLRRAEVVVEWHSSGLWRGSTLMAMACGACVCANPVAGLADAFEPGRHFQPYGPGGVVDAVLGLLADGPRRASMAEAGCREALLRHTWRQRVSEMLAILDEAKVIPHIAKLPPQLFPTSGGA
ncbi:MAG: glycosyltransferase [Armatimonadia bacterium]|nr:glycosyltransferase [Armatimonadia bacterium]